MKMRAFAVFLALCASVLCVKSEEFSKERLYVVTAECKEKTGATDEDVATMFKLEPAVTHEAKCLHACAMKKFDMLNESGKLVKEASLNVMKTLAEGDAQQEKLGAELTEACVDIDVVADHCEASEQYKACFSAKAKENGYKFNI